GSRSKISAPIPARLITCLGALDNSWNLYGNHSSHYRTCKTGTWQATSNRECDARSSSVI
ncbi:unnamed protein product, partial [Brassica rapa subsp. trilocularis]